MADVDELVEQEQPENADERVQILLRENAKLRKKIAGGESGWDIIRLVLEDVYDKPSGLLVRKPKRSTRGGSEVATLHVTDVHYGKVTPTYSVDVCETRLLQLCQAVSEIVELRRKFASIDHLQLLLGGDMIEGQGIFPGQAYEVDVDIVSQMLKEGPEVIANLVLSLASQFRTVEVVAVPGNHGRIDRFGSQRLNADSVFYEVVRKLVSFVIKDDRITWDLPLDRETGRQWYSRFKIAGPWEGMLVHGDQVRGQLGFPWYGFGKKVAGWRTAADTTGFQFLFSGHFHTHAAFDLHDCTVLSTGSVESTNCYALENMAASGEPKQRLCFFNDHWGLLADHPIKLSE